MVNAPREKQMLSMKKSRSSVGSSGRNKRGISAAQKAQNAAIDSYNKNVNQYNSAIKTGDYNTAQKVASSIKTTNLPGKLTAEQNKRLADLQKTITENNRKAQVAAQQLAEQRRKDQIAKATSAKPNLYANPAGDVRPIYAPSKTREERAKENKRIREEGTTYYTPEESRILVDARKKSIDELYVESEKDIAEYNKQVKSQTSVTESRKAEVTVAALEDISSKMKKLVKDVGDKGATPEQMKEWETLEKRYKIYEKRYEEIFGPLKEQQKVTEKLKRKIDIKGSTRDKKIEKLTPKQKGLYGPNELTAEEELVRVEKIYADSNIIQKFGLGLVAPLSPADPFGFKSAAIKIAGEAGTIRGLGIGYTKEQRDEKLRNIQKEAFTEQAYDSSGKKQRSAFSYSLRSPVTQTALIAGGGVAAGSLAASAAPILKGTTVAKVAMSTPGRLAFKGLLVGGIATKTATTGVNLARQNAPMEDYVAQFGQQAIHTVAGLRGFQIGMENPLPIRTAASTIEVPTGKTIMKEINGQMTQMPETKTTTIFRGLEYKSPVTKSTSILYGRTTVPAKIDVYGRAVGTATKNIWGRGIPQNFAYPKGFIEASYTPGSGTDTAFFKAYTQKVGTSTQNVLQGNAMIIRRGTEFVKVKPVGYNEFRDVKSVKEGLTTEQQKALHKWVLNQKKDVFVYGSSTVKAQTGFNTLQRPSHDLDLQFLKHTGNEKAQEIVKILNSIKGGNQVMLDPRANTQVIFVNNQAGKLLDVHGYDSQELSQDTIYGMLRQANIPIDKIESMGISQTTTQKMGAVLTGQRTPEGKFYLAPDAVDAPKYSANLKSIGDYYNLERYNIAQLSGSEQARLMPLLEEWKQAAITEFGADALKNTKVLLGGGALSPSVSTSPSTISNYAIGNTILSSASSFSSSSSTPESFTWSITPTSISPPSSSSPSISPPSVSLSSISPPSTSPPSTSPPSTSPPSTSPPSTSPPSTSPPSVSPPSVSPPSVSPPSVSPPSVSPPSVSPPSVSPPSVSPPSVSPPSVSPPSVSPPSISPPSPPSLSPKFISQQKGRGFTAQYRPEGAKNFKSLNPKKPQTFLSAMSTMARKVDKTLSARGRVIAAKVKNRKKGKKTPVVDTKDSYYKENSYKFRPYKLKQRKKSGALQKGEFIEKAKYRLDDPKESGKIQTRRGKRGPFGF